MRALRKDRIRSNPVPTDPAEPLGENRKEDGDMLLELTNGAGQPLAIRASLIKAVTRASPNVLTGSILLLSENVSMEVREGYNTVLMKWREALEGRQ